MFTSQAVEARSPHSILHSCSTPGASWSLTPNWAFLPLGLGFGALGTWGCASIYSPNAWTIELLGHGFILSFHSLSNFLVLMEVPKEDQCLGKSRACTAVPMADFV